MTRRQERATAVIRDAPHRAINGHYPLIGSIPIRTTSTTVVYTILSIRTPHPYLDSLPDR